MGFTSDVGLKNYLEVPVFKSYENICDIFNFIDIIQPGYQYDFR